MATSKATVQVLKGQVTGIFYNEVEPDDYGKTISPVISIDKKYRVRFKNRDDKTLKVKDGENWAVLSTGDSISVETKAYKTPKGTNYYARVSDVRFISGGSTASVKKISGYSKKSFPKKQSSDGYDDYTAGIAAGHGMNNAVSILVYNKKPITEDALEEHALMIARVSLKVRQMLLNGEGSENEVVDNSCSEREDVHEHAGESREEEDCIEDAVDDDTGSPF